MSSHNNQRRNSRIRLGANIESILEKGRRNSAAALERLRSGSLPSWAGGPPSNLTRGTPSIDEENEIGFLNADDEARAAGNPRSPTPSFRERQAKVHMKNDYDQRMSRVHGNVDMGHVLSALYAKLLVVMGIAFPCSEVISRYIPPNFYDGFYMYLYLVSIVFMVCILGQVVKQKFQRSAHDFIERVNTFKSKLSSSRDSGVAPDVISHHDDSDDSDPDHIKKIPIGSPKPPRKPRAQRALEKVNSGESILSNGNQRYHFGSFYLRMGAVAFGIGSMIYSGLEFGQYFEIDKDTKCHNYWMAFTPAIRMIFTFMQMYFIFFNSKMAIGKASLGVQFGLMHLIGTNLSVWLNVLVEETRHEILHFYDPVNQTLTLHAHDHGFPHKSGHAHSAETDLSANISMESHHHRDRRGLKAMYECRRSNVMGNLVDNASPFLFPCTIEFSLICAAVCYVMWKSTAKRRVSKYTGNNWNSQAVGAKRSHHHYTVDCSRANKGLFLGIFVLVLTIMSLIVNFVMISSPGYKELAMYEVNITEVVVYSISALAVLLGMCQVRELRYDKGKTMELDIILLTVAQTGSILYNVFSVISGQFQLQNDTLVLPTALLSLIQLLLQTLFIIDASHRSPETTEQAERKPGREVVTFLMVTNLAMWLINTLENSRGDSHPVQLEFYGIWAWTIITDISMPLAIFYRFHSTVCLCEIWKKAYKMKPYKAHS